MGNLLFSRGSEAKMSQKVSEGGFISQKISKSITYYYTPIPTAGDKTCPTKECPTPTAFCPASSSSPSAPVLSDSPPSSSSLPLSSPLDSSSAPLLSGPLCPTHPSDSASPSPRPLLLLLPWLGARPGAVAKYRDLYLEQDMDVLVVESGVMHFLWPRWGLDYGLEVLKVLEEPLFSGRPVVVHACSIGGYTFTQVLTHMVQGPKKYASLAQRVIGHIYDSMVVGTLEHMATGLGKTLAPRLEALVKNAAMFYFWLFKTHTADYYNRSIHVFHNSPVTAPALFFFCENDALCDPVAMERLIDVWRNRGMAVQGRKWKESVHAGHMRCHPEDYLSTLEKYLNSLPIASLKAKM
ncbi:transmembrane protein 53-like isoform X1 [Centroberyx gerrardi]|uniref:transmembrane protein 53-like isoform X1 n=2 Tax=Centroberyx gerrardi TaxID=166262 RepID=UPI003AAE1090